MTFSTFATSLALPEPTLAIFGMPGHWEILGLLLIGLLLFGKRLPEVGRSLGRSIVEFKRGVKGIQDEIDEEIDREPAKPSTPASIGSSDDGRRVTQGERMHAPAPVSGEPS
ncbi:MAG: twin-arginine translocase TatA/TatE family subunit [Planctomycetota bacterium]